MMNAKKCTDFTGGKSELYNKTYNNRRFRQESKELMARKTQEDKQCTTIF